MLTIMRHTPPTHRATDAQPEQHEQHEQQSERASDYGRAAIVLLRDGAIIGEIIVFEAHADTWNGGARVRIGLQLPPEIEIVRADAVHRPSGPSLSWLLARGQAFAAYLAALAGGISAHLTSGATLLPAPQDASQGTPQDMPQDVSQPLDWTDEADDEAYDAEAYEGDGDDGDDGNEEPRWNQPPSPVPPTRPAASVQPGQWPVPASSLYSFRAPTGSTTQATTRGRGMGR